MRTYAATAAVLAASAAVLFTQERAQQPAIRTQANYVRVDVYATSGGRPVQDLRVEDFEVLEDGVPQAIENFEHIAIRPTGPQTLRAEPNTVASSLQAAANPRGRLFIIFLDGKHVSVTGTWNVRQPLVKLMDRIVGPEDLVGIMTSDMSPAQVTFARRTDVFAGAILQRMPWGQRHTLHEDPRELEYHACYPLLTQEAEQGMNESELVTKMKARRRERMTLDALRDLAVYIRNIREERTAVIAVTEGWLLYRPDPQMTELRKDCTCRESGGNPKTCQGCRLLWEEPVPGRDPIGVTPGGRLGRGTQVDPTTRINKTECDAERLALSHMDNEVYFRTILEDANRANVSFYPVDPRGLAVFDAPLGPEQPPTLFQDRANFKARHEAMYNMAAATDGMTVMGSNDLDAGLKRIADDLTSYYLLGYYSTNPKLDGRFRKLTVRVKRTGVDVRSRRGYRAPTEAEVNAARAAAPPEPISAEEMARTSALASLARIRPEAGFRIHAAPAGEPGGRAATRVWVAGELRAMSAADPWSRGGAGEIEVTAGGATTSARVTLAPGERTFMTSVSLPKPAGEGTIEVRARLAGADAAAARLADSISVPASISPAHPLLFRRGPTTGNRYLPAAAFLFSRTERVRVDVPVFPGVKPGTGRVLDRSGKALPLPVTVTTRSDDTGPEWLTADITLAPLGAGDYLIEISYSAEGTEQKSLTAIRVIR